MTIAIDDAKLSQAFTQSLADTAKEYDAQRTLYGFTIERGPSDNSWIAAILTDEGARKLAGDWVADACVSGFGAAIFAESALDDVSKEALSAVRAERARLWGEHSSQFPDTMPTLTEAQHVIREIESQTASNPIFQAVERLQQHYIEAVVEYVSDVQGGVCPLRALADRLRSIGEHGDKLATAIEADPDYVNDPLLVWFDPVMPGLCGYAGPLASALWIDQIRPEMEAGPPNPARIVIGDDSYWKVPKVMSATAWSVAGMANVDIDGNQYTSAPGATRYLPRAFAVAPKGKRPHQQTLGLALYEQDDQVSMFARTVGDTQALVSVDAAKLTLLFMSTGGKFNKLSLGELTKLITPTTRRVQKRDRESVARSLHIIRTLGLVLPDDTDVRLFDIRAPHNPTQTTPEQVIAWAYTQTFRDALSSFKGSEFDMLTRLRGEFIVNMTAVMNFNGNQGVEMRTYLGACSMFNDSMNPRGQYSAQFAPKLTLDRLAAQTNSLSQNAVDLIREGKTTRSRSASKSRDLKKVAEALDYLESAGLIVLKGPANARQILAPDEWQEAHKGFRKDKARPDYDK